MKVRWQARMLRTLALLLVLPATAHAFAPVPPCAGAPVPAYAALGAPPNIEVFHAANLGRDWPLSACAGLPTNVPELLIAVAGRFVGAQDRDALLARIGAISASIGVHYWSVTDRRWENLVTGAYALTGPRLGSRRPDFTADEMKSGQEFYFAQDDNRSSAPVIYRVRIRDLAPGGFTLESENVTPVQYFFLTIYRPGDLRSEVFLQREAGDAWDYYSLTAIAAEPPLFGASERSYVNRAGAQFRHIAGIPTDREPPAAP
jgi:uncharacterized protein DUF6675